MKLTFTRIARCSLLSALVTTALVGAGALHAQVKERTLRFSYVQPKDSHMGFGVQKFAEIVAQKSNKKITVRGFPDGTLGGDIQMLSSLQGGTMDMTTMPPSLLVGRSKVFGAFSMHFLFNDFAEADAVLDGPIGQRFIDKVPQDLVGLAYWDHGFRNISNGRRSLSKLEDFKGLKLRVMQEPLFIDSFNALGTNPVAMSFTELYGAMESRAMDGQDNPIVAFETNKFYEVQKHLSATRHVYQPLIVLIGKKTWDQLSADERKLLQDAARETAIEQRKASRAMEDKSIAAVQKAGTIYTEISAQERARMREAIKPVNDKYLQELNAIDRLPSDMVQAIEAYRAKP